MLDIWIRIWQQVDRLGHYQVKLRWVPSHQVAHSDETWQQRVDRRASNVADRIANKGRRVHALPANIVNEIKAAETTTKEYHRWIAYVATVQHNGDIKPDHDKRQAKLARTTHKHKAIPTQD